MRNKVKTAIGEHLGSSMKLARSERNISQQEVADIVGVSRGQIANIEMGLFQVSSETLMEISLFLDISLDELRKHYKPSDAKKKKLIAYHQKKIEEINAR
jgi:transcriptional regulator with XRE-family HTH domain